MSNLRPSIPPPPTASGDYSRGDSHGRPQSPAFTPPLSGSRPQSPRSSTRPPAFGPPPTQQRPTPFGNPSSQMPSSAAVPGYATATSQPPPVLPSGQFTGVPGPPSSGVPGQYSTPPYGIPGQANVAPPFGGPRAASKYGAPPQGAYGSGQPIASATAREGHYGSAVPQSPAFAPPISGSQQQTSISSTQPPPFGPPPTQQRPTPFGNPTPQAPSSAAVPGYPPTAQPPPFPQPGPFAPGGQFSGVPGPPPSGVPGQYGASSYGIPGQANVAPQSGATRYGTQGGYPPGQPIAIGTGRDGQYTVPPPPPMGGGIGADPTGRGLPEDFQSLSVIPLPGSMDSGIDPYSLPRPSDDSELPASTWPANCHPRYLRLTCNSLPNSHSLVARWHLPLGAVVHPLAEAPPGEEVPVVNSGATGIVRCRRCRTYINAYVTFTDGGRRWRCNVCVLLNEVPVEYFCPLDANGKRRDVEEKPELSKGSVEFVAPTEYMVRPPMPPVYFFLIDVSVSAIRTGMLQVACETIRSSLDKLPGSPRTQIGFITFDSTLHFYSLKSSLTQPQMMVVAELDDPFLPMPDDLLVNLADSRAVVDVLLDSLPSMFQNNINVESALGPALRASFMVMSQLGGKLLVFQSTLPSLGVGRLKLRGDDPRLYGTEKESMLRNTEEQFYKQMAADFSKYQIGVNIYAFAEKYTDIASLGTLPKYTGGQVMYYPGFKAHLHGKKFSYELARDLSRETAWEAVMRIRCGKGIRFSTFHGHFMLRSSDLLALPAVDADKAFAMQLTLEDTLLTTQTVYFQVAVLYTSSCGERRIRVHTMAAPVTTDLTEMYRSADVGAITSIMSRLAIEKSLVSKLDDARQATQLRLVKSLREYRNLFAIQHRTTGRLIFPESLRLLSLYVLAINKSLALRGGFNDVQADERSAAAFDMQVMPIPRLLKFIYPSLYRFDDFLLKAAKLNSDGSLELPKGLHASSAEHVDPRGAYLLNDGQRFVLWLGKALPSDFVGLLCGSEAVQSQNLSNVAVSPQNNDLSRRFITALDRLREGVSAAVYQECYLVRQGEQPREAHLFLNNLVEDRTNASYGYVDWMLQIYRQFQQNS